MSLKNILYILGVIVVFQLPSVEAFSNLKDWKIIQEKSLYYLKRKESKQQIKMNIYSSTPHLIEVRKMKNLYLIIYDAGETGTLTNIRHINAIIYNPDKNKFIDSFPFRHEAVNGSKLNQPHYIFKKDRLEITDELTGEDSVIFY